MRYYVRQSYGNIYMRIWILITLLLSMKRRTLKWFTLIEILIVMVIIWILAVVLCESYITISKIALKVEQEKNLSEESLTLTQVLQAISDEAQIDYDKYDNDTLSKSKWYTWTLYLTWWKRANTSIYTTWDCPALTGLKIMEEDSYKAVNMNAYTWCQLVLDQEIDGEHILTNLTSSHKIIPSQVQFRIIPYNSDEKYFEAANWYDNTINSIHQQAFWMFIRLYSPLYQPYWINDIDQPLQLFFNLNA